jgi:HlyD family secretion protein
MNHKLRSLLVCTSVLVAAVVARAETISAMGRVLPVSGVIDLGGTGGDSVDAILVKEGQWVEAGTPLARLSSAAGAEKRVHQAEAGVASAKEQAEGDVKSAELLANASAEEARVADAQLKRIQDAKDSEFVAPDTIEARGVAAANAQAKLQKTRQDLAKARSAASDAVAAAESELRQARAALAASQVQAPIHAQVLKIFAKVGQPAGGVLFKIGDTSKMMVIAEVYESDVLKVKSGQKASVSSVALKQPMTGTVQSVSRMVYRNTLQSMDPSSQVYAHVVEVPILMDEVEPLDRLVYLQVDVKITL